MGILNIFFGRSKLQVPNREKFFAVATAAESLRGRSDIYPSEKAGIVFNPVESIFFDNLDSELRKLLKLSGNTTGTRFEIMDDSFGTRWVILDDPDFGDLVCTIHLISETIYEHGFADRLLAAVFKFIYESQGVYWIYSYKRGAFHPFIISDTTQRDNSAEMRLGIVMEQEKIPVEQDLERWYSLSGIPF